jgi:NodT family efflux transporter outer membrane factor (OMF) lipoprotein
VQFLIKKGIPKLPLITTLMVISGCAGLGHNAPQSVRLDPDSLDIGAAIRSANSDANWPQADWWRAYNDTQLTDWIAKAEESNPSLSAAQARVREALSIAGVAKSATLPQVNGRMQIQRQHWSDNVFYGPPTLGGNETWNNLGELGLSYHLDLWGKDENAAEGALDVAHAKAADYRAAQLELESNIVRVYVQLSLDYALLDIARSTLNQQQQVADLANKRLKGGIGTQLEVAQAEAPLPEYERQIDSIEESIALGRNQLAALAGRGPGAADQITRPQLSLSTFAGLPSTMPAELVGHRPDVVAARWEVAARARGIDVAKAEFYPDVDLLASLGGYAAGGPIFQFLKSQLGGWAVGSAVSLPIFTGGRLRSQLGAASAEYDAAVDHYNQTLVDALKQISDEIVRTRSLEVQLKDAQRSAATADKSYQLAREAFRRGLTDYVNVLVAQTQLLRAQDEIAKVQAEQLTSHARLEVALGGGLLESNSAPALKQEQPSRRIGILGLGTSESDKAPHASNSFDSGSGAGPASSSASQNSGQLAPARSADGVDSGAQ